MRHCGVSRYLDSSTTDINVPISLPRAPAPHLVSFFGQRKSHSGGANTETSIRDNNRMQNRQLD